MESNTECVVSSTAAVKTQLSNQHPQHCYTCGKTNYLSRYCPKNCEENSKQPEISRIYNRFPTSNCKEDGNKCKLLSPPVIFCFIPVCTSLPGENVVLICELVTE